MGDVFGHGLCRIVVSQVCAQAGFDKTTRSANDYLTDLLINYLDLISSHTSQFAQLAGRQEANLHDVSLALSGLGIPLPELNHFCKLWTEKKSSNQGRQGGPSNGNGSLGGNGNGYGNGFTNGDGDGLKKIEEWNGNGHGNGHGYGHGDGRKMNSRLHGRGPIIGFPRLEPGEFPLSKF